jgi:VWFA-related protein
MSLAQESQPGLTFRSDSALLELEVKATGKGKKPVHGLRREDFSVLENGEAQEITSFEYVPPVPSTTPRPTRPDSGVKQPVWPTPAQPHTWIYIATHIGPLLKPRVIEAIREFVEEQMTPGVAVSLNGAPFVWDRELLLTMLDGQPGPDGKRASLVDVQSGTLYSEQFDAGDDGTMIEGQSIPRSAGAAGLIDPVNIRRSMTSRATLYRYIDAVQQMGRFPGKKVIVLYSHGLRVRNSNINNLQESYEGNLFDVYRRLSAEANRRRVSIYTVDARGLVATVFGGDSTYGAATAGDLGPPPSSSRELRVTQIGLATVADLTGGKAVIDTNDLGKIFDRVQEDLGNYYVLGYYPKDKTAEGRERKIHIEVSRPNVKLSYRKSYYEDLEFVHMSKRERKRNLEQLVLSDTSFTDVFLETVFHFYRGDDGKPVLAYNAAILPGASWTLPDNGSRKLHYTFVASVREVKGNKRPIYDGVILERTFSAKEWDRLRTDPTSLLQFPSSMKLPAGEYLWKAIVRDERTGDVGTYRSRVVVPEFVEEASPSSLLLTRQVLEPEPDPQGGRKAVKIGRAGAIPFGEVGFLLSPENVYPAGASLFFLYDLYNVLPSFAAAPPAPRVFLVAGDKPLESPPFEGFEAQALPGGAAVRYAGSLDTKNLRPGDYTLILRLPNTENAIFREFRLQSPGGPQTPMGQAEVLPQRLHKMRVVRGQVAVNRLILTE